MGKKKDEIVGVAALGKQIKKIPWSSATTHRCSLPIRTRASLSVATKSRLSTFFDPTRHSELRSNRTSHFSPDSQIALHPCSGKLESIHPLPWCRSAKSRGTPARTGLRRIPTSRALDFEPMATLRRTLPALWGKLPPARSDHPNL